MKRAGVVGAAALFTLTGACAGSGGVNPGSSNDGGNDILIDDFEDGDGVPLIPGRWYGYTDASQGGESTLTFTGATGSVVAMNGAGFESQRSLEVSYSFDQGTYASTPYVGFGVDIGSAGPHFDLYAGLSYAYKGGAHRVRLSTSEVTDYDYFGLDLPESASWQTVTLPFTSFAQEGWGKQAVFVLSHVQGIDFPLSGTTGVSGTLQLDNLTLVGTAPTYNVVPATIELPQPTGPFTIVRGQRRTLIDSSRDLEGNGRQADATALDGGDDAAGATRALSAEIWYPSDSPGSGATVPYMDSAEAATFWAPEAPAHVRTHAYSNLPFASSLGQAPTLLFSPSYNGLPRMYTAFIEEAVSRGYIVVAISHTLWTPVTTFADGSTIGMTHPYDDGIPTSAAGVWLADARFVLDELVKAASSDPKGEIEGHVDLTKVGMFGHSFGGSTSFGMLVTDERVKAAIDFDCGLGNWATLPVSKPVFMFHVPGVDSSLDDVFNRATGGAFQAVLANSLHFNFSDLGVILAAMQVAPWDRQSALVGTIDPLRGVQEVNGYVQAFFDFTLKGTTSPLLSGPTAQYPDVINFSKKP